MACVINDGWDLGCATIGGVSKVYIGTYDDAVTYTFDVNNNITAIAGTPTVYLFEQDIEWAGVTQTPTASRENSTVFFETKLSIKLIELTTATLNSIKALTKAPIFAVVVSNAGAYYVLGVENAGRYSEGDASLGVAQGDMNGANLTFTWKSANGAYTMNSALLGTSITIG